MTEAVNVASARRHICVVTSGRADYGIMRWLIQDMKADPDLRCSLIATGSHFAPEFGSTYKAIENDGIAIDYRIELQMASDTAVGMIKSAGVGMISFADAFSALRPDIVVVLGDRYEICAVSLAAFMSGIPVAHISGGEKTEGAIDDVLRHVITKTARFHFVAADAYARRVIQLGEAPDTVFNVGDPGIDNIHRLELFDRATTAERLGLSPHRPYYLVTYHPVTADVGSSVEGMRNLLEALDRRSDHDVVLTLPNADAGSRELAELAQDHARSRPDHVRVSASLGQKLYLSAMRHCDAVVGNSSSGIVEAPAMKVPTIDIGSRQTGRLKASSIIECPADLASIEAALQRAATPEFRRITAETRSVYGDSDASRQIHARLKTVDISRGSAKAFHDLKEP